MNYMQKLQKQAILFTIFFMVYSISYTATYCIGWRVEPLILDMNCMAALLGFWLTFIFITPLWGIWDNLPRESKK